MYQEMQGGKKTVSAVQSSLNDGLKLARILRYSASTPILFVDDQFTVLMANSSWSRLLGWEQAKLAGRPISALLRQDQLHDFYDLQRTLRRDEQYWRGEFQALAANGSSVCMEMTSQRVELRGLTVYAVYLGQALEDSSTGCAGQESPESHSLAGESLNRALQSLEREHH